MTPRRFSSGGEVREDVQHPARLERACALEELGLEHGRRRRCVADSVAELKRRRAVQPVADRLAGGEDVVVTRQEGRRELSPSFDDTRVDAPCALAAPRRGRRARRSRRGYATGEHPCGIAAGFGAVWVANDGSGTLARIDPKTNRVTRRVRVGRGVCSVATGSGFVWMTELPDGLGRAGRPAHVRRAARRVSAREPFDVLVAGGHVWATTWGDGALVEVEPQSLRVVRRLDVGANPAGLGGTQPARCGSASGDRRRRSRASSYRVAWSARVPVGVRTPAWFSAGTRDFWISADDNALVHLDPKSERVLGTVRVGRTLGHPSAAANGTVWVPDKEIDRVFLVDPRRPRARLLRGRGRRARGAAAFGSMLGDELRRLERLRYRPR